MAKTEILGIGELSSSFKQLGRDMELRSSRRMVVAGGKILKGEAQSIARAKGLVKTGSMVKNVALKRETSAPAGTTQYNLGVRHGRDLTKKQRSNSKLVVNKGGRVVVKYRDDPFYWRFQEFEHKVTPRRAEGGTTTYQQRLRNGKVVTRRRSYSNDSMTARRRSATVTVPAKPFIAPALANKRNEAIAAMAAELAREIEKAQRA